MVITQSSRDPLKYICPGVCPGSQNATKLSGTFVVVNVLNLKISKLQETIVEVKQRGEREVQTDV